MKRILLTLIMFCAAWFGVKAMSYEDARRQAWFLTDKMAYELNLTPDQYDRAYEINLDYFMSLRSPGDCTGPYWSYRDYDLRCVLFDWQYNLYRTLDYFFRPVRWVRSRWYYPVTHHYRYGYYYFDRPAIYVSYRGGGWRRRSHNDRSPYYGMHFDRGQGMRDRYHNGAWGRPSGGARPNRPGMEDKRPDKEHKPGRPGTPSKPGRPDNGHQTDRPNLGNGNNRPERPTIGSGNNRPGNGNDFTRPNVPNKPGRPNQGVGGNNSQTRPTRPSLGNGRNDRGNGETVNRRSIKPRGNAGTQNAGTSRYNGNANSSKLGGASRGGSRPVQRTERSIRH